jgi:uncharacterized protein YqgC (DUF456 family)
MQILVWCLTVTLILIGLAGVIVPLLPGTTLIFLAMVVHKLLLPGDISWLTLGWIGCFWLMSVAADFVGVAIGARTFGGTKWGMAGASGGALVGMFVSLPALLLGTLVGALLAEKLIARQTNRQALRAGLGATAGFLLSTVARLALALAMIVAFAVAVASD